MSNRKHDFTPLSEDFWTWVKMMYDNINYKIRPELPKNDEDLKRLFHHLSFITKHEITSVEDFENVFVRPLDFMDPDLYPLLNQLFSHVNLGSPLLGGDLFDISMKSSNELRALRWTCIQVQKILALPDYTEKKYDTDYPLYKFEYGLGNMPSDQCLICGLEHPLFDSGYDLEITMSGKSVFTCCRQQCKTVKGKDPHVPECCTAIWRKKYQRITRALDRAFKNSNKEISKTLLKHCEAEYKANLTLNLPKIDVLENTSLEYHAWFGENHPDKKIREEHQKEFMDWFV